MTKTIEEGAVATTAAPGTEPKMVLTPAPIAPPAPITYMGMLQLAVERGADMDQIQKFMDLNDRQEAKEARKAFVQALAAFKADPPRIVKDKTVSFGEGRGKTEYEHATLAQVCSVIGAALAQHGLSHTWDIKQHEDAAVEVTCILTHVLGHSERVTMRGMPDSSGSKNLIQQNASTVTYLERYTLLAATGLAAGEDTDGAGPVELISAEQKESLVALMKEIGGDTVRFLKYLKVKTLDDLPAARYFEAQTALEAKRKVAT